MSTLHVRTACAVFAVSIASLALLAGCQGTTREGTLYTVTPGRELDTYLPADIETVHEAALRTIQSDFGFTLDESALDAAEGIVLGRTAMDNKVRIKLYKFGEKVTRIKVYVGPMGSEAMARDVLSAIETRVTG